MNQQLSNKASIQMLLTEKQNEIQSLKDKIVQVTTAQQDLKENMIQKSKTFAESKHAVETEVVWAVFFSSFFFKQDIFSLKSYDSVHIFPLQIEEIALKIKEQRKINAGTRKELDIFTSELQDKEETITQCEKVSIYILCTVSKQYYNNVGIERLVWLALFIWFQHISQMEKNITRIAASKIMYKEWLHGEKSQKEELDRQK